MRILVTGATGQVGWELARSLAVLGEVHALNRAGCDLAASEAVAERVAALKPDVIVNAAAYTAVDRAEKDEAEALRVNGTSVGVLAREARRLGALLIHYSTDYVFDGEKPAPYVETDPTGPRNAYGRSKLAGELAVREEGCDHLILRTTWVYASRGQNFLKTMLRLGAERPELKIVGDQWGAPTWARHLSDATAQVLRQAQGERRDGRFVSETLHATAGGATTWHGFAEAIHRGAHGLGLLERCPVLHAIATEEYPLPAARPKNSRLDGSRLFERFGVRLPEWGTGVGQCLEELTPGR